MYSYVLLISTIQTNQPFYNMSINIAIKLEWCFIKICAFCLKYEQTNLDENNCLEIIKFTVSFMHHLSLQHCSIPEEHWILLLPPTSAVWTPHFIQEERNNNKTKKQTKYQTATSRCLRTFFWLPISPSILFLLPVSECLFISGLRQSSLNSMTDYTCGIKTFTEFSFLAVLIRSQNLLKFLCCFPLLLSVIILGARKQCDIQGIKTCVVVP